MSLQIYNACQCGHYLRETSTHVRPLTRLTQARTIGLVVLHSIFVILNVLKVPNPKIIDILSHDRLA